VMIYEHAHTHTHTHTQTYVLNSPEHKPKSDLIELTNKGK